jgi:hypothetical protein
MLRNLILETPRNILPKNLNIEDLIAREVINHQICFEPFLKVW